MCIRELGPNPALYLLPLDQLHHATRCPEYLTLNFVCMTLSHRINRLRDAAQRHQLVQSFYRYRCIALRCLSDDIKDERKRTTAIVIAGIINLLLSDVSADTWFPELFYQK